MFVKNWHGILLMRISVVKGFAAWLYGQTIPYVEDDPDPSDWAYYGDFYRYSKGWSIID